MAYETGQLNLSFEVGGVLVWLIWTVELPHSVRDIFGGLQSTPSDSTNTDHGHELALFHEKRKLLLRLTICHFLHRHSHGCDKQDAQRPQIGGAVRHYWPTPDADWHTVPS